MTTGKRAIAAALVATCAGLASAGCGLFGQDFLDAVDRADERVQEVEDRGAAENIEDFTAWMERDEPALEDLEDMVDDWVAEDQRLAGLLDDAEAIMGPYRDTGAGAKYLEATARYREALEAQTALWESIAEGGGLFLDLLGGADRLDLAAEAANAGTAAGNSNDWDGAAARFGEEETHATQARDLFRAAHEKDGSLGFDVLAEYADKGIAVARLNQEWADLGKSGPAAEFNAKIDEIEAAESAQAAMDLPEIYGDPLEVFDFEASAEAMDALWEEAFGLWTDVDDLIEAGEY